MEATRVCPECGVEQDIGEFLLFKNRGYTYRRKKCRGCVNAAHSIENKKAFIRRKERMKNDITRLAEHLCKCAKSRAKSRDQDFDLDAKWVEERLVAGKCEATGIDFVFGEKSEDQRTNPWSPSLDRINNDGGYTKDNVQVVVWMFNQAKMQWSREQFMVMVKALAKPLFKEAIESGRISMAKSQR